MRLADWMKQERYTDAKFIDAINGLLTRDGRKTYTWRAVRPWRIGWAIPRPGVVAAIAELSANQVVYEDHVVENAPHRTRVVGAS